MERAAHRLALPALRHAAKKKGKKSVDWKMAKKKHRLRHPNFKPADLPEFQIGRAQCGRQRECRMIWAVEKPDSGNL
jgi:hypothetical protein